MRKSIAVILVLSLLLAGCGAPAAQEPVLQDDTTQSTEPITQPTEPETQPTEPETQPTEPEPVEPAEPEFTDPLTGEALEEAYTKRPIAVSVSNDKEALPSWNVAKAQMLWELPHEYSTTRMVAMYSDVSDVTWLGAIRSARTMHISLAMSFNAILVHAGGSNYAMQMLADTGWDDVDGVYGMNVDAYFDRDWNRVDAGVSQYNTMYTTGSKVLSYSEKKGYTMSTGAEVDYGYQFAADGTPEGGSDAKEITVQFKSGGKKTYLTYDESAGSYTLEEYGLVYTDGISGEIPHYENVLVLRADVGLQPGSDYRLKVDMVGSGTGYFACGGKIVPITWSRSSELQPFSYALEDGTPLTMGVGTTYAAVIYSSSGVVTAE